MEFWVIEEEEFAGFSVNVLPRSVKFYADHATSGDILKIMAR